MIHVNRVPTHHINQHPVVRAGRGWASAEDGSPIHGRPEPLELVGGIDPSAYTEDAVTEFVRGAAGDSTVVAYRVAGGRVYIYGLPVTADEIEEPDYEEASDD